ncbi:MAG: hypothetical protein JST35_07840 [Armatimonadetes bacterium]|nr:hypothetical protein [Armatimonadota bacterium]
MLENASMHCEANASQDEKRADVEAVKEEPSNDAVRVESKLRNAHEFNLIVVSIRCNAKLNPPPAQGKCYRKSNQATPRHAHMGEPPRCASLSNELLKDYIVDEQTDEFKDVPNELFGLHKELPRSDKVTPGRWSLNPQQVTVGKREGSKNGCCRVSRQRRIEASELA